MEHASSALCVCRTGLESLGRASSALWYAGPGWNAPLYAAAAVATGVGLASAAWDSGWYGAGWNSDPYYGYAGSGWNTGWNGWNGWNGGCGLAPELVVTHLA